MVEQNSHSLNAAPASAASTAPLQGAADGAVTQKIPDADGASAQQGAGTQQGASVQQAASAQTAANAPKVANAQQAANAPEPGNSVAARRLAHGLSPEATTTDESLSARRRGKDASAEERMRKVQREHKAKLTRLVVIVVLLVLLLGILIGFWLVRWGLHDDAASIQGTWRVQGTDTTIEINDEKIILTDEVAYEYVLDPDAKTLTFEFGALTGNGRYRFSLDHNMLAIDDGEFGAADTLVADIPWTIEALSQKLIGNQEKNPELDGGNMVLERVG